MSYNIDHIKVLKCKAWMSSADAKACMRLADLPECSFLEEMKRTDSKGRRFIDPKKFWWTGESSGNTWEPTFLAVIAQKIHGELEAIIFWEGGDTVSGLRIVDGVVTEHEVIMTLGEVLT